ncbi:hypothetical protein GCM10010234_69840 [Streptomyces hawaiiensis]
MLPEKPSTSNASEAAEVRQAAQKAGTVFMEAFHCLFHPVTRRLHELLASGELGELRHVSAYGTHGLRERRRRRSGVC